MAPSGDRYSIHDHLFDFSQPPIPCNECHGAGEVDPSAAPPHEFNVQPVRITGSPTLREACLRCHNDKDMRWVNEKIDTLKLQL